MKDPCIEVPSSCGGPAARDLQQEDLQARGEGSTRSRETLQSENCD